MSGLLYLSHSVLLAPLLVGLLRRGKARLQGRQGPSLWQPYWDLAKFLRRGETVSATNTWLFRAAPLVALASSLAVALMVPWLGRPAPLAGDLFLVIYLLALGKFAVSLAALDPGTTFGGLGASREASLSVQAEPAMVLALGALAVRAHSSSLALMLAPGQGGAVVLAIGPLLLVALWLATTAELARMPLDDPTTHLELTMVHEALLLENSGRNLALIEWSVAIKTLVLFGLMGQVVLAARPALSAPWAYLASLGLIAAAAVWLVFVECLTVRLRWRRIPNLLGYAMVSGVLACLVVALKG